MQSHSQQSPPSQPQASVLYSPPNPSTLTSSARGAGAGGGLSKPYFWFMLLGVSVAVVCWSWANNAKQGCAYELHELAMRDKSFKIKPPATGFR